MARRRSEARQGTTRRSKQQDGGDLPQAKPEDVEPDWTKKCEVCGARPVVPITGLCGPCTFGEAETFGGNW